MADRHWKPAFLALLIVYLAVRVFWSAAGRTVSISDEPFIEGLFKLLVWVVPSLLAMMALRRESLHDAWRSLGLRGPAARGCAFGLVATIPMALAAFVSRPRLRDLDGLVGSVLLGPFAEEVLFRGFLFTLLWRAARWPWPVALAASAMAFGLAHHVSLYAFALALPGALFAWVFYRWGSLWPAIGLHACMNLWWEIGRGDRRAGFDFDLIGAAQIVSMVIAVLLTLRRSNEAMRQWGNEAIQTLVSKPYE